MNRTLTRYKINENEKAETKQIAGIKLTRNWVDYENPLEALSPYIRTKARPHGIIDTQVYSINNQEVLIDSKKVFDSVEKVYTRQELGLMLRDELIDICLVYGINPVNKADHFLAKMIIQKQNEFMLENEVMPKPEVKPVVVPEIKSKDYESGVVELY